MQFSDLTQAIDHIKKAWEILQFPIGFSVSIHDVPKEFAKQLNLQIVQGDGYKSATVPLGINRYTAEITLFIKDNF